MINEAIGKILGMAMAYGVSGLGLFLAYVNYRRRIVKADKVMSGTAWLVLLAVLLGIGGGIIVVAQLAKAPTAEAVPDAVVAEPLPEAQPTTLPSAEKVVRERTGFWKWIGILAPAAVFLFATVITAALHRHFSTHHPNP